MSAVIDLVYDVRQLAYQSRLQLQDEGVDPELYHDLNELEIRLSDYLANVATDEEIEAWEEYYGEYFGMYDQIRVCGDLLLWLGSRVKRLHQMVDSWEGYNDLKQISESILKELQNHL